MTKIGLNKHILPIVYQAAINDMNGPNLSCERRKAITAVANSLLHLQYVIRQEEAETKKASNQYVESFEQI